MEVDIHTAKTHLSKLANRAEAQALAEDIELANIDPEIAKYRADGVRIAS